MNNRLRSTLHMLAKPYPAKYLKSYRLASWGLRSRDMAEWPDYPLNALRSRPSRMGWAFKPLPKRAAFGG